MSGSLGMYFANDAGAGYVWGVHTKGDGEDPKKENNGPSFWSKVGSFFDRIFGRKKKGRLEVGSVERTYEQEAIADMTWSIIVNGLFGSVDPYSAIGNMGIGPYAEERENVGMAAMIFINPEAAAEGLERKALSKAAMSKIWGAGPLRIDPKNLPKTVTNDFTEILAGRGVPRLDDFGLQRTVQRNSKWNGALEWQIKDVSGTVGLNSSRIVQHPDGRWGLVINHDYNKIIQIPTSSVVKWK